MKSLKLNSFEISKAVVPLGVQGENGTRYVYYDASEMVSDLGAGTFSYYYQPEGIAAYPMPNTWRDGNKLCVTLTSSDMAIAGKGFLQFVYRPNSPADGAMKTVGLATFVAPALGSGGTVPDPWENYIERAEDAADRAETAAESAEYLLNVLPAEYNSATVYNKGSLCMKDGLLKQCNSDNVTGSWTPSYWATVRIGNVAALNYTVVSEW